MSVWERLYVEKLNPILCSVQCHWITPCLEVSDAPSDISDATDSSDGPEYDGPEYGAIGLGEPLYIYEKMKSNYPACFLFGRRNQGKDKRIADVWLGNERNG